MATRSVASAVVVRRERPRDLSLLRHRRGLVSPTLRRRRRFRSALVTTPVRALGLLVAFARSTRPADICAIGAVVVTPLLRAVSLNLQSTDIKGPSVAKEPKEAKVAEATGSEIKISQR